MELHIGGLEEMLVRINKAKNKSFKQISRCKLCLVEHFSYSQNDLLYVAPKYINQEQTTMLQSHFTQ